MHRRLDIRERVVQPLREAMNRLLSVAKLRTTKTVGVCLRVVVVALNRTFATQ